MLLTPGFMTEFNINGANAFVSETMDHADDFLQVSDRCIIYMHVSIMHLAYPLHLLYIYVCI